MPSCSKTFSYRMDASRQRQDNIVTTTRSAKYFYLFVAYFVVLHLCSMLDLVNLLPGGKPAYIVDIATILPILLALYYWNALAINTKISYLDFAVIAYLIISVLSVLLYFQPDNPADIKAYFYGIHHFVLPVFLYFAVKTFNSFQQYKLLRFICYLNITAVIIGIILFFWRPDFYLAYLEQLFVNEGRVFKEWEIISRMQSYFGSTTLGSVIATTIVLFTVLNLSRKQVAIFLPIMILGVLLTSQRGGFIAASIALLYTYIKTKGSFVFKIMLPIVFMVPLLIGFFYYFQIDPANFLLMLNRYSLEGLSDSFNFGETRGYLPGWSYFVDFPLGVGLGATSSAADAAGLTTRGQVVDANFMRILADLGFVGLLSFVAVLGAAAISALKRENGFGWLLLFGLIAAICIGTNTLDSYYVSQLFWVYLGVIGTKITHNVRTIGEGS